MLNNLPLLQRLGGYMSAELAMQELGIKSRMRLTQLVGSGKLRAAKFDKRTLLIEEASVTAYKATRHVGRPRKRPDADPT